MRLLTCAGALLALAACSTYVEPTGPNTATILQTTQGGPVTTMYADDQCNDPQSTPSIFAKPFKIAAGEPFYFRRYKDTRGLAAGVGGVAYFCASYMTFIPEAGATYELGWSTGPGYCAGPVTRILESGERVSEPTAKPFDAPTCEHY